MVSEQRTLGLQRVTTTPHPRIDAIDVAVLRYRLRLARDEQESARAEWARTRPGTALHHDWHCQYRFESGRVAELETLLTAVTL